MSGSDEAVGRVEALIRETLAVEVPSPDTDLIDAGLIDSLSLLTLITEIEQEFGIELPLDDFDIESFRTARQMAASVTAGAASQADA